jgi:hypothetical protein
LARHSRRARPPHSELVRFAVVRRGAYRFAQNVEFSQRYYSSEMPKETLSTRLKTQLLEVNERMS